MNPITHRQDPRLKVQPGALRALAEAARASSHMLDALHARGEATDDAAVNAAQASNLADALLDAALFHQDEAVVVLRDRPAT
jgi:hypothetical protein